MGAKRQTRQPHHQQMHERKGRSWTGPINLRDDAERMRKEYIAMTFQILTVHYDYSLPLDKQNCFARFNLNIPSGV